MGVVLDIKNAGRRQSELIDQLRPLARFRSFSKRLLLSSADAALLKHLRALPFLLGIIAPRFARLSLQLAIRLGCYSWHPQYTLVSRERVAAAHAAGLRVFAWTVDDPKRAHQLVRCKVDGIFTNDPAYLRKTVKGF
jgi:glycerophosphoryl diester phosphodiesterase